MTELTVMERQVFDSSGGNVIVIETERISVKERIGLAGGIAFVMGSIIGSGIFISPKGALENSGSVGMSLVIWVLCGFFTMVLGLVYAELGVILPKSGGNFTVIKEGIGSVPAFVVSWTHCVVSSSGSRTVQALVLADYVCAPIFLRCRAPNVIRKSIAAAELLMLAIINTISVSFVSTMQGFFAALKTSALIVIIFGGLVCLFKGYTDNFEDSFNGSTTNVTSISLAIYSCMWAYSGYQSLNEFAEEVREPKKTIPKAIVISVSLVTIIYIATNLSYFVILPIEEFLSASAVAYTWGKTVLRGGAIFIPISIVCSVHGALNGGFFSDGRVRFAAARAGHLPEILSFLHRKSGIPLTSLYFNTFLSLIYLIPGDIIELINLVSFVEYLTQLLSIVAFLRLRYQKNDSKIGNNFRTPLLIGYMAIIICVFMLISPFISNPRIEFLYGAGFVLFGLVMYIPFVHFGMSVPGFERVTIFTQLVMDICPTVNEKKYEDLNKQTSTGDFS